jgi:hypothetical protein
MSVDTAIADILAAASSDAALGRPVSVDGEIVVCTTRSLTVEEASQFAGGRFADDGLAVEGLKMTVDRQLLGYIPAMRSNMVVGGAEYTVSRILQSGDKLRLTLTRYTA